MSIFKDDTFVFKYSKPTSSKWAIGTCEHVIHEGRSIYHNFSTNRSKGLAIMIGNDYRRYFEHGKTYIVNGELNHPKGKNFVILNPWRIEVLTSETELLYVRGEEDGDNNEDDDFMIL